MTMAPRLRKLALTAHVACSVGFLGAVAVFLALAIAGLMSRDAEMMRAAYRAMALITWSIIIPLSLAALLTGIVQALGTPWGLFRHFWVLVKLGLTVIAIVVLVMQTATIDHLARAAASEALTIADLGGLRFSLALHSGGGVLILLAATALSVWKPRGMTRYGWRKQHEPRAPARPTRPRSCA